MQNTLVYLREHTQDMLSLRVYTHKHKMFQFSFCIRDHVLHPSTWPIIIPLFQNSTLFQNNDSESFVEIRSKVRGCKIIKYMMKYLDNVIMLNIFLSKYPQDDQCHHGKYFLAIQNQGSLIPFCVHPILHKQIRHIFSRKKIIYYLNKLI